VGVSDPGPQDEAEHEVEDQGGDLSDHRSTVVGAGVSLRPDYQVGSLGVQHPPEEIRGEVDDVEVDDPLTFCFEKTVSHCGPVVGGFEGVHDDRCFSGHLPDNRRRVVGRPVLDDMEAIGLTELLHFRNEGWKCPGHEGSLVVHRHDYGEDGTHLKPRV